MKLARPAVIALIAFVALPAAALARHTVAKSEAGPEVSYTLPDGSKCSAEALRGKGVLISLWSRSCTACGAETPCLAAPKGRSTRAAMPRPPRR